MYEQYLQMPNLPTGAVLNRILVKEKFNQRQLAERSGILYQRICDYIANRRRITVEASLKLEQALGVDIAGFFYRIQANHDIYAQMNRQTSDYHPDLSCYRNALFWDTSIGKLDWKQNRRWIIRRVFEYGSDSEIEETICFYGKDTVLSELRSIQGSRKADVREEQINRYLL